MISTMHSRVSRWIIAVTLIVLAVVLHLGLCQWVYRGSVGSNDPLFGLGFLHVGMSDVTGLWPQRSTTRSTAVIAGVVLPLGMLALCAALVANWRFVDRKRAGLCPKCGYPSSIGSSGACPECGTAK